MQADWVQAQESKIQFGSAKEAFEVLSSDPTMDFGYSDGWAVATPRDTDDFVVWTFTPEDHPAHPAVVRREVVWLEGEIHIDMSVLCHAAEDPCDQLVEKFEGLNAGIAEQYQRGL
ncbi:MAG: hypothetical protein AAGA91_17110 [Pseudomonadota bacterium]